MSIVPKSSSHTPNILRRELSFDVLDSSFVVATSGGDSVGRGETLTHVHASELAFWPKSTANDIWNGLIQAVPNTKGTAIFVESTANGVTGIFYDLWKGAVEGQTVLYLYLSLGSLIQNIVKKYQQSLNAHRKKKNLAKSTTSMTNN